MKETRFKETEIGRIPEDWEVVKLEDKGALLRGSINPQMFPQKQFVEYSMPSFDNGCIPEVKNGFSMQSGRTCIKSPVLLYNKLNVRQRRIWYIETCPDDSICSMEFLPYVSDKIDLCCLKYFVNTDKVTADFVGMSKGTSNSQKRIAPSDFLEYKIGLPKEKEEQTRIASALTSIDNLISSLDKLIEKKKNIKQGTMQQLLTGKKRLNGFYEPWVEKQLGELLQYEQPTRYLVSSTEYSDNGIPVLTAGKTFVLGYTNETTGVYDKLPVIIFDDFVTESKYVDFPFKAKSSAMKMLTLRDNNNNLRFLYEILQMIDFPMTDHKRWWIGEYSHIVVRIPSIDEQNAIASVLTSMDNAIAALEAKKAKYEQIKQGMMQQLLTGKIRLV